MALHVVEVYIQAKRINSNADVANNIWLNYRGGEPENNVENDNTNKMSFKAKSLDTVIWRGMAVEDAKTSNGVLTKKDNDGDYRIVMSDITRTYPDAPGNFIKNIQRQAPLADYISANTVELSDVAVEEYTIKFSIYNKSGKHLGDYEWDPVIRSEGGR
jgi:hypothetical protein